MCVPVPNYPMSTLIKGAEVSKHRRHRADGDMWPITWAMDGHLYAGAGDNQRSPMNFWRIEGHPDEKDWEQPPSVWLVNNMPLDPSKYCVQPNIHPKWGIKPASVLGMDDRLYFAVELMNFGDNKDLNRQHNISAWIMTSDDGGCTWNEDETARDFFTGRLASPHFLQFGRNYEGAKDEFVYAYFPAADDGNSYWENGDYILLGRVPREKLTVRSEWVFWTGAADGGANWSSRDAMAQPVFRYPLMTGENHVSYNKGLGRYIMGNYSFLDLAGKPMPYHQNNSFDADLQRSQLTLFEAPEPWGPWSLFYQDDDWGRRGGYQPAFPTKWMDEAGTSMWMVYSGSEEDYNFTLQKITLRI